MIKGDTNLGSVVHVHQRMAYLHEAFGAHHVINFVDLDELIVRSLDRYPYIHHDAHRCSTQMLGMGVV